MKRPQLRDDVPWSKRQEIPDPQVLDAADQYAEACRRLNALPAGSGVLLPLMNSAAMAIELYLKCLSAEIIHVKDEQMPEMSRVYASPSITGKDGHRLVGLFDAIPADVRSKLIAAFDTELKPQWGKGLRDILKSLEGVFMASRYPFESGTNITKFNLDHLMGLVEFLGRFAKNVSPIDRITWKRLTAGGSDVG